MIIIFSHAHPSVSKGGAEVSAYNLYRGLRSIGKSVAFVAMCPMGDMRKVKFDTPDEYVVSFQHEDYDHVFHSASPGIYKSVHAIVKNLNPEALIFHHFLFFGINTIHRLVDAFDCHSVMVLHEFLAICHHHGQMVTNPGKRLCEKSSHSSCATCFSDFSPEDFNVRKSLFYTAFMKMHKLVSPSRFLAKRFVDWGIPAEKIEVIENGLVLHSTPSLNVGGVIKDEACQASSKRVVTRGGRKPSKASIGEDPALLLATATSGTSTTKAVVFGYFGQINPFKGIDLLLDAAEIVEKTGASIKLRVHGNVVGVSDEFRKRFEAASEKGTLIEYVGPYNNVDVIKLMSACDYILMGSKWWENSPVVIQEAFAAQRPLVVPNIGGMAEKVEDGIAGRHFIANDANDLARVLSECSKTSKSYKFPKISTSEDMANMYLNALV